MVRVARMECNGMRGEISMQGKSRITLGSIQLPKNKNAAIHFWMAAKLGRYVKCFL
jgi:hypothetical protein